MKWVGGGPFQPLKIRAGGEGVQERGSKVHSPFCVICAPFEGRSEVLNALLCRSLCSLVSRNVEVLLGATGLGLGNAALSFQPPMCYSSLWQIGRPHYSPAPLSFSAPNKRLRALLECGASTCFRCMLVWAVRVMGAEEGGTVGQDVCAMVLQMQPLAGPYDKVAPPLEYANQNPHTAAAELGRFWDLTTCEMHKPATQTSVVQHTELKWVRVVKCLDCVRLNQKFLVSQ